MLTSGRPSRLLRWEQLAPELRAAGEALWIAGHRYDVRKLVFSDRARLAIADLYLSSAVGLLGSSSSDFAEHLQSYPGDAWVASCTSYTSPANAWTATLPLLCHLPIQDGEAELLGRYLSRILPRLSDRAATALARVLRVCNTCHVPRISE